MFTRFSWTVPVLILRSNLSSLRLILSLRNVKLDNVSSLTRTGNCWSPAGHWSLLLHSDHWSTSHMLDRPAGQTRHQLLRLKKYWVMQRWMIKSNRIKTVPSRKPVNFLLFRGFTWSGVVKRRQLSWNVFNRKLNFMSTNKGVLYWAALVKSFLRMVLNESQHKQNTLRLMEFASYHTSRCNIKEN